MIEGVFLPEMHRRVPAISPTIRKAFTLAIATMKLLM